ncbi:MAG: hypothetical protein MJZ16_03020 [Bacteroidales bacterium]|nr:hypothetical protein [Bacteroidales bacterium]
MEDYDYDEGFLGPEIIEDYEDQTVEEYYLAHPEEIPEDYIEEEDYIDDAVEDNPLDVMEAHIDYLIAELQAGRIPGKESISSTKQHVSIKGTPKTNSTKRTTSAKNQKDNLLSFIIAVGILFIISIILILC